MRLAAADLLLSFGVHCLVKAGEILHKLVLISKPACVGGGTHGLSVTGRGLMVGPGQTVVSEVQVRLVSSLQGSEAVASLLPSLPAACEAAIWQLQPLLSAGSSDDSLLGILKFPI